MPALKRPAVYVTESGGGVRAISGVGTSTAAFLGVAERGPMTPKKVSSLAEARTIFGTFLTSSFLMYAVKAFFDEGGTECYIGRQAHYTDVTDADSVAADAALRTLQTSGESATAGAATSTNEPTFNLAPGDTLLVKVDGNAANTATFDAARATRTGSGLAIVSLNGDTLLFKVDGGDTRTITFTAAAVDVATAASEINSQSTGGFSAYVSSGQLALRSDRYGTGSSIQIVSGTALTELGHSAGTTSGTGDVSDIDAVTYAEIETVLEADLTGGSGVTVTQHANGYIVITSDTTGASSSIEVTGGNCRTIFGFDTAVHSGSASGGAEDTLTVKFGRKGEESPGTLGNSYSVKSVLASKLTLATGAALEANADAGDTSLQLSSVSGLVVGSVIRITNGSNVEYRTLTAVRREVGASGMEFYADFAAVLVYAYTTGNCAVRSQEFTLTVYDEDGTLVETWTQLSMNSAAANYALTLINDEVSGSDNILVVNEGAASANAIPATDTAAVALAGGDDETSGLVDADKIGDPTARTGIYALADYDDFSIVAMPGESSVRVLNTLLTYAESRMDLFAIIDVPTALDQDEAVTWRQDTLGSDTSYGAAYFPWVYVADPIGVGSSPTKLMPPSGHIAGLFARVDSLPAPEKGPWTSPAGAGSYGKLNSVVKMERSITDDDADTLNPAGVNAIRKFKGQGFLVYGARTLSLDTDWMYVSARRSMTYFEQSIVRSFRSQVFRNNNFRLWGQLKDAADAFLSTALTEGAMPAEKKVDAFFIQIGIDDGVMTQADVDAGIVKGKFGIALNKPGEFLVFDFQQYKGSASASE